eukprot:614782_1
MLNSKNHSQSQRSMATAYPIRFKRDDRTLSDISYLKECTMQQLLNAVKAQLTSDQFEGNTIQFYDSQLAIDFDDDLEAAFQNLLDTDSSDDDDMIDIANVSPLVLTIILTPSDAITENDKTITYLNQETDDDHKT